MKPTIDFPGEYTAWCQMRYRCSKNDHPDYKNYGIRGISVCERWNSFTNFISDMGVRPPSHTLERMDNNGNYSPENCRWATRHEQIQNRRNMHYIEYNGLKFTLNGWAKHLGISSGAIHKRKKLGLPLEQLLAPKQKNSGYYR